MTGRLLCALGRHAMSWTDGRGYISWRVCRRCGAATFRKGFGSRPRRGRLILLLLVALAFVAGVLAHSTLAASRTLQQPGLGALLPSSSPVAAASPLPRAADHTAGETRTPSPAAPARWHPIRTTWYGSASDGLIGQPTADGSVCCGLWVASGRDLPLGTLIALRWTGADGITRTVLTVVRDRHGHSRRPFLDLTAGLSAWLFGTPGNHLIEYRRVSP